VGHELIIQRREIGHDVGHGGRHSSRHYRGEVAQVLGECRLQTAKKQIPPAAAKKAGGNASEQIITTEMMK
jgi:hypothetical protein